MPAPRNCRECGAVLPGDVRWCLRCHARVTEFTARAPLHRGDFVDVPRILSGENVPHRSRWDKTATTFGPTGRIVGTAAVLLFLAGGFSLLFVVSWPALLLVAGAVIRDLWKPGWVVPGEIDRPPLPVKERPRVPRTRVEAVSRWAFAALGLIALLVFVYGPVEAQTAVLSLATVVGFVAFLRSGR
jgi:hypothetical protein